MYADWLEERADPRAILYRERQRTGPLGMKFVTVPAGTFWMGGGSQPRDSQRQVSVGAFQIGVYPVTQGQWRSLMQNNPSYCSTKGRGARGVLELSDADLDDFPVESVSWNDTQRFLEKLNEIERGNGWLYRLPAEAEWEYACRGAAVSREECSFDFYFDDLLTNEPSYDRVNFTDYGERSREKWDSLGRTSKVGSYRPNRLGIYDMHGNVWEWCADRFGPDSSGRVQRGGSWLHSRLVCRAGYRGIGRPIMRHHSSGFRVVAVPR
jgi:formylglycine-generating enzyme required for sulfatase activity